MLTRQNYYDKQRAEIKSLVLLVLNDYKKMTKYCTDFLHEPSKENRELINEREEFAINRERQIEKTILDIISLEYLNNTEIKWLFAISRILGDLNRIGDQMSNIITITDVADADELATMIDAFFTYEKQMMEWLVDGIHSEDVSKLQNVITHDEFVNKLNKNTFKSLVQQINEKQAITESKLKMVVISRFLERIGDHLVNVAKIYSSVIRQ